MASYPVVEDLIPCGPSKWGFDATGGGQVFYWSAAFDVVARVFRKGTRDETTDFFFQVFDKRRLGTRGIDDAPESWEWRDEAGRPCDAPAEVAKVNLATEKDYYGRIMPALKRIEKSFFESFAAEKDTSTAEHFDVRSRKWVKGLPASS